jgi:hypothetical protein
MTATAIKVPRTKAARVKVSQALNASPSATRMRTGYTLKSGDVVASGRDVHRRAMTLAADGLHRAKRGGGIVDLLLPVTAKQYARLSRDRNKYVLAIVKLRSKGLRADIREQATSPELLLELISLSPARTWWKKQDFVRWLLKEQGQSESLVYKTMSRLAPDLLAAERGFEWSKRVLGEKKSR